MALKPGLTARQEQKLALTPAMRQSLHVLRQPAAEMLDDLAAEAAENPFLRIDWPTGAGTGTGGGDAFETALATTARQPSLVERLRQQIGLMSLPPRVAALAAYMAGDLREDGYLDTALEDYAERLGVDGTETAAALAALQGCEPAGVGARDLAECLVLQLRDRGLSQAMAERVLDALDRFAGDTPEGIAAALGVAVDQVPRLAGMVRSLRARPVEAEPDAPIVLRPDLVVERDAGGGLRVRLADGVCPRLRIDRRLAARSGAGALAGQLRRRAETLIEAVAQRQATLLRIGALIAARQEQFFDAGPEALAPLSRAALAEALGLHPSTVGRAVAGKALDHGGRLYPLSMFFANPLGAHLPAPVSGFAARQVLARIVADESPDAPLSDSDIRELLRAEGVDISRRTVAKYRACMRIPSSYQRHRNRSRRGRPSGGPESRGPTAT